MTESRALVCSITSVTDESFRRDHLKLCFLWYDEVLFETIGEYNETWFFKRLVGNEPNVKKTITSLTDVIFPLNRRVGKDVTEDLLEQVGRGYPRWGRDNENYNYPEPENAEQFAHNKLLEHIETEHGVSYFEGSDTVLAEGRARVAVDAVLLWERVNTELPCMLQTNNDEKLAMLAAQEFTTDPAERVAPFSLFEAAIPSLASVTWQEVVRMRKDGAMKSLRQKIGQVLEKAGPDLNAAKTLLDESEQAAIENIVEKSRPKVRRVAIESFLANLPGMAINPFSVFFGLRDTTAAYKKQKELGWYYLLGDIRQARVKKPA